MEVNTITNPRCFTAAGNSGSGNAPNKRIGVCKDCGYQWYGRSKSAFKPSRCPECRSHECAWKDELTEDELSLLAPKLHGLGDVMKPDETRIITLKQVKPSPPPAKAKGKRANTNSVFIPTNAPPYLLPAGTPDEEEEEMTAPATIDIPGVAENVPLIPQPVDEESETAPVVAWENRKGEIEYAALVDPVTLDELDFLKAQAEEQQDTQPPITLQDIDILKAAGLIDNAGLAKETEEGAELNETAPLDLIEKDEEDIPKTKAKQNKGGISRAGLIILMGIAGGILAVTYLPLFLRKRNAANKSRIEYTGFGNSTWMEPVLPRNLSKLSNPLRG